MVVVSILARILLQGGGISSERKEQAAQHKRDWGSPVRWICQYCQRHISRARCIRMRFDVNLYIATTSRSSLSLHCQALLPKTTSLSPNFLGLYSPLAPDCIRSSPTAQMSLP